MVMMNKKDLPTYYNIVGAQSKAIFATAPASKVLKLRKTLQEQFNGEKLEIVPVDTETK